MPSADRKLLDYVKTRVRRGDTHIRIPRSLYEHAGDAARRDVRELCAINGIEVTVTANA
jgi:hypothetical protein